jgi:hypothetical protein
VTFWITDGKLTKYAFHVTGSMDAGGQGMEMQRTTKVEVPDDAKKKLQKTAVS